MMMSSIIGDGTAVNQTHHKKKRKKAGKNWKKRQRSYHVVCCILVVITAGISREISYYIIGRDGRLERYFHIILSLSIM